MTDIVVNKNKLEKYIELFKTRLNECDNDIFYLDETIPFKHIGTCEEGTITNLPFWYSGYDYYIIYGVDKFCAGGRIQDRWLSHITHVNVNPGIQTRAIVADDGYRYEIIAHRFCNSLNNTFRADHFKNTGLIKATLSYNIRQQNPSDAYLRADTYLKLFTNEKTITCRKCGLPILPEANPIERVLQRHIACDVDSVSMLDIGNYYYNGSSYGTCTELPDDSDKCYKNITQEQLREALKNLTIDVDYTMVGCGSAGSNIAFQLSKTDMLNKGVLYDNDIIENKNLKNTVYSRLSSYHNKAAVLQDIIKNTNSNLDIKQTIIKQRRYNPDGDIYNNKYVFNMVDSLTTRLQVAENAKYRYIVDTRFKGLNCSLFIVDKENKEQYQYYIDGLKQSIKNYIDDVRVEKENITPDIAYGFRVRTGIRDCASKLRKRSEKFYKELPLNQKEALLQMLDADRQTCNSPNIIDIYTIMAGTVVSAIRNIESGKDKPFTHLEMSTENGMLQQMVVVK